MDTRPLRFRLLLKERLTTEQWENLHSLLGMRTTYTLSRWINEDEYNLDKFEYEHVLTIADLTGESVADLIMKFGLGESKITITQAKEHGLSFSFRPIRAERAQTA